jgi:hypothetical protein
MWPAALPYTEMVRELTTFWVVVSSVMESMLGRSSSDTTHMEVLGELVTEFQKEEGRHSRFERPTTRIYNPFLGPPPGWACLVDHLNEAARQIRVELAAWWEKDVELVTLWCSTERVWDLMLGGANGPSSLATFMSVAAELLKSWINTAATNGVCWGAILCWLPPYHISRRWTLIWRCLGPDVVQDLLRMRQMLSDPKYMWLQIHGRHTFLLWLPITLLIA